jgi:hypothetical protein
LQAQQALSLPTRSFSTLVAILATLVAAALALALVVTVNRPATSATQGVVATQGIGAEQIAHDRSEGGLGVPSSIGAEQINHNRSEDGLANG